MAEWMFDREFSSRSTLRKLRLSRRICGSFLGALFCGLLIAGCEISPVITNPEMPTNRYRDCESAAEAYCEHVVGAEGQDLEKCVAEYRFKCISGRSD